MSDTKKHPAVGIDLGTTFSAVAYLDANGKPDTVRNAEGDLTTPSAVFFDRKHSLVGVEAVEAGLLEPERLAQYAKRDVGEDSYEKEIRGEKFPPEVIQSLILRKLREDAELKLGEVTKAVITVPAFFNEPCRKATQDAGRLAGLEVLDIINEPTAAAITYGVQQGFLDDKGKSDTLERVLVYDLGGGTFDVTVMEIDKGNYHTIATAGDVYLGGVDWDRRIVDFIAEEFIKEHNVDPREDPRGEQELVRKANQAKHALTQRESVSIAFAHEGDRLRTELSQEEFAKLSEDLVERTLMTVQLVLDDAALAWSDLTRLILVGGSTRMPMVRDELEKRSGLELDRSLSPDEAVSHGAALYAGMLLGHGGEHAKVSVTNVNSHDLGILAVDPKTGNPRRQVMIPRNSPLPAAKLMGFKTHTDNQSNVKIEVVEGGDDRGVNSTKIGKCIVDDLPPETPKGTRVEVQFDYSQDGRLRVSANLPTVERNVQMTLDRAAGLSDQEIEDWIKRIDAGLADPEEVPEAAILSDDSDDVGELLPDDDDEDIPFAVINDDDGVAAKPVIKVGGKQKTNDAIPLDAIPLSSANKVVVKPAVVKPKVIKPTIIKPVAGEPAIAPPKKSEAGKTPVKKLVRKPAAKVNPLAEPGGKKPTIKKVVKPKPIPAISEADSPATPKVAPKTATPKKVVAKTPAPSKPAAAKKPAPKKIAPVVPVIDVGDAAPPAANTNPSDFGAAAMIDTGDDVGSGAAKILPAAIPKLDLGDGTTNAPKASNSDFAGLMGLDDGTPKPAKMDAPFSINTDDAAPKQGNWKNRGKKLSSDE